MSSFVRSAREWFEGMTAFGTFSIHYAALIGLREGILDERLLPIAGMTLTLIFLSLSASILRFRVDFLIYVGALLLLFALKAVGSEPGSSLRALFAVANLLIYFSFWSVLFRRLKNRHFALSFVTLNSLFLTFLLVLQWNIPEWAAGSGGIRMSGGTNPNTVGLLGLVSLFVAVFILKLQRFNAVLGLYVLVVPLSVIAWSFSRSAWVALLVTLAFSAVSYFRRRGEGVVRLSMAIAVLVTTAIVSIAVPVFSLSRGMPTFDVVINRVVDIGNFASRLEAWKLLLLQFEDAPFLGGLDWWQASNYLSNLPPPVILQTGEVASSPHSLYLRLLAETGAMGLVVILSYPAYLCGRLLNSRFHFSCANSFLSLNSLACGFIVGCFSRELFEDSYLVGVFDFSNFCVVSGLGAAAAVLSGYPKMAESK